jgi:hypothetical protein
LESPDPKNDGLFDMYAERKALLEARLWMRVCVAVYYLL